MTSVSIILCFGKSKRLPNTTLQNVNSRDVIVNPVVEDQKSMRCGCNLFDLLHILFEATDDTYHRSYPILQVYSTRR
ncbi:hypothetical protein [Enterobacter phage 04_vB_Eclo_IJM]|nr:hypothetical protein [Enterobacter phage 04_vB_Eclo_IJM]